MAGVERIVIIGGGLTAARAAESVRSSGFEGGVTVVTNEDRPPYERPPLSKGYLQGDEDAAATITHPAAFYAEHDIDLRTGATASALDSEAHLVTVDGDEVPYDRLLLATGATPRPFTGPGAGLTGVHLLRSLRDSTTLRTAIKDGGRRVVVVGAGWIGLEVAAAARGYGNEVTVVGRGDVPLASAIGPEMGEVFAGLQREHGVDLRMGAGISALRGDRHVEGVVLGTGEELAADLVLFGIGATPDTRLAASAGLEIDDGVTTDASFRTSARDVFAAGDVANVWNRRLGHRLRVEHWANADASGRVAGRILAGETVEYDEIPYFFTDQYDLGMEYSGYGELAAGVAPVIRGDLAAREFIAFWQRAGKVVAGMNVNTWDVNADVQRVIRSERVVSADELADPAVPLAALAGPETP